MSQTMTASPARSGGGVAARVKQWDVFGLLAALIVLFLVLSLTAPNFLTTSNQLNILRQAAFFGIVAFAMTLVIVSGEIDISVGSQAALSSALLGVLVVNHGWPMWTACLAAIVVAAFLGAVTGLLRSWFAVPTFISTLALFLALRGAAQLLTNTFPIPIDSSRFFYYVGGSVLGVPTPAVYIVVIFVIIAVVARKTVFGRSIYAVGGNAKSAELSGINLTRVRVAVMVISGISAAITGLLLSAQLSSGNSTIANGLEFDAIAAAIIGGSALSGGKGTVVGTLVGVLFVAVLLNGMVLLGVNPYAQQVIRGVVVLLAVLVNVWRSRRSTASA